MLRSVQYPRVVSDRRLCLCQVSANVETWEIRDLSFHCGLGEARKGPRVWPRSVQTTFGLRVTGGVCIFTTLRCEEAQRNDTGSRLWRGGHRRSFSCGCEWSQGSIPPAACASVYPWSVRRPWRLEPDFWPAFPSGRHGAAWVLRTDTLILAALLKAQPVSVPHIWFAAPHFSFGASRIYIY